MDNRRIWRWSLFESYGSIQTIMTVYSPYFDDEYDPFDYYTIEEIRILSKIKSEIKPPEILLDIKEYEKQIKDKLKDYSR